MTAKQSLLTRTLFAGRYGKDVAGVKRTVYRGLDQSDAGTRLKDFYAKSLSVHRTYGPFFAEDVNRLRKRMGFNQSGRIDQAFWAAMVRKGYPDALAIDLMNQYRDEHKVVPKPPQLVEPEQGFSSLDRRLWEDYSTGRNMGLTDLGTYNHNSRLPSGTPSDHAVYPAEAFDLGFSPQVGYAHPVARKFFHLMAGRPEIHYVICGSKIWSTELGLHEYTYGGHGGHVHTSGHRR